MSVKKYITLGSFAEAIAIPPKMAMYMDDKRMLELQLMSDFYTEEERKELIRVFIKKYKKSDKR